MTEMAGRIAGRLSVIPDAFVLVFSEGSYLLLALILAVAMGLTYPLLFPLAVGLKKVSFLAFRAGMADIIILTMISILFGLIFAMQVYKLRSHSGGYASTGTNIIGTAVGFVSSKACCLLPLLLLTVGATAGVPIIVRYSREIRLLGLFIISIVFYWTSSSVVRCKGCCSQPGKGG